MNWIMIATSGLFGGVASLLLRLAALRGEQTTMLAWMPWILRGAAAGSYGIGFVLYALALRRATPATAYPLMVAVSILVVLTFTAWHEHALRPSQMIGAAFILSGVYLIVRTA